jgi:hypothetical protein
MFLMLLPGQTAFRTYLHYFCESPMERSVEHELKATRNVEGQAGTLH